MSEPASSGGEEVVSLYLENVNLAHELVENLAGPLVGFGGGVCSGFRHFLFISFVFFFFFFLREGMHRKGGM